MNEGTQTIDNAIYSYKTKDGLKCYTPNPGFAQSRSIAHGTEDVYIEMFTTEEK